VSSSKTFKYPSQIVVDALRFIGYAISKPLWRVRYHGLENIPDKSLGGLIIAANHQTYIDPVWICLPMRRRLRFMAFDKAFGWPIIGPLVRYLGAFPVSIENHNATSSMREALRSLRDGAALMVFPEGAREFADGELLEFKPGAVRLAIQAGVPILPVTVTGGNKIWPQKQKYPRLFRRVGITYHPLLYLKTGTALAFRENLVEWNNALRTVINLDRED
jgi:1-acyl-sn-glycerol-3-phosphate acyltransferase